MIQKCFTHKVKMIQVLNDMRKQCKKIDNNLNSKYLINFLIERKMIKLIKKVIKNLQNQNFMKIYSNYITKWMTHIQEEEEKDKHVNIKRFLKKKIDYIILKKRKKEY